jgi:hypothetical protein
MAPSGLNSPWHGHLLARTNKPAWLVIIHYPAPFNLNSDTAPLPRCARTRHPRDGSNRSLRRNRFRFMSYVEQSRRSLHPCSGKGEFWRPPVRGFGMRYARPRREGRPGSAIARPIRASHGSRRCAAWNFLQTELYCAKLRTYPLPLPKSALSPSAVIFCH